MSRWLSSVGNLLEKLDDQVEETAINVEQPLQGLAQRAQLLLRTNESSDEDGSYYEEEEEYEDYEEEEAYEEEDDHFLNSGAPVESQEEEDASAYSATPLFPQDRVATGSDLEGRSSMRESEDHSGGESSSLTNPSTLVSANHQTVGSEMSSLVMVSPPPSPPSDAANSQVQGESSLPRMVQGSTGAVRKPEHPAETIAVNTRNMEAPDDSHFEHTSRQQQDNEQVAPANFTAELEEAKAKIEASNREAKQSQLHMESAVREARKANVKAEQVQNEAEQIKVKLKTMENEFSRLQRANETTTAKLEAAEKELQAQSVELEKAAKSLEEERQQADEDYQDVTQEHDEVLKELKGKHQAEMKDLQADFDERVAFLRADLKSEKSARAAQGGDHAEELQEALDREEHALKELGVSQNTISELQQQVRELERKHEAAQLQIEGLSASAQESQQREGMADDTLEQLRASHQRQLAQRQARESELEATIASMGVALEQAKRSALAVPPTVTREDSFKEKYLTVKEELEAAHTNLDLEQRKSHALQEQLDDIVRERNQELEQCRSEYEERLATQQSNIAELTNENNTLRKGQAESSGGAGNKDFREAQATIANLSERLARNTTLLEQAKAESISLKGRLDSANSRADAAEQQSRANDSSLFEVESGEASYYSGSKMRRRVKRAGTGGGAGGQYRGLSSRSVSSALGLRGTGNVQVNQIAVTVDALDEWMVETGHILRHEPLVRVGFMVYLLIVHLWCLGLVFFHTVQSERSDLSSVTAQHAMLHTPNFQRHHT